MTSPSESRALVRYTLVGLVLTILISWILFVVRDALLLIYISALTAIGLSPLAEATLERGTRVYAKFPRWAAVLIVYLIILGIMVGVGLLVIQPLIEQARGLWKAAPDLLDHAREWLESRGVTTDRQSVTNAISKGPVGGSDAVGTLVAAVWGFIGGVFGAVTILILSFYMLVDGDNLARAFIRLFPSTERPRARDVAQRVTTKVSAWLGGQLLLAAIIGCTASIGLWLFGVPYFYVLGLIAAAGELIPVVGPLLSAIPAVVVALSMSPALAAGVALFFFLQQQFENHVLVPKVMSRQLGVSPVGVIVALLIGGSLLGVVGAILAIPTAAILQVVFEEWSQDATS